MRTAMSFVEILKCVKLCVHADSVAVEGESPCQINLSVTDYSDDATRQNTKISTLLESPEKEYAADSKIMITSFILRGF